MPAMAEEFGTINVRRGDRTREIEIIRQQYRKHREALAGLVADAPTDSLATEYQRLIRGIDGSMAKLDELEARPSTAPARDRIPQDTQPVIRTEPGSRQLVGGLVDDTPDTESPPQTSRMAAILLAGLLVLGLIGGLMWWASRDERPSTPILTAQTDTAAVPETAAPVTPVPEPATALRIEPGTQDFGAIRKGTRAVREFEMTNTGDAPISVQVQRSACRCLYYSYSGTLAPGKKETLTVTLDAAKAKAGAVDETLAVTAKGDPSITASIHVIATIR